MGPRQLPRPSRTRTAAAIAALALTAGSVGALPSPAFAADPIDGPQTSGDPLFPNVGNGGYDVSHYDIDIAWTPGATLAASTIDATTSITATTTGSPLQSFSLDFEYPTMTVESVTVNGVPAGFAKDEDVPAIKHKLVVTPATPVEGVFTTVVEYSGIPVRHVDADGSFEGWNVTADGATFLNQPIGAMTGFPNNNTPTDLATYTLDIDIPNTITNAAGTGAAAAASNGELRPRAQRGRHAHDLALVADRADGHRARDHLDRQVRRPAVGRDPDRRTGYPRVELHRLRVAAADKATINTRRALLGMIISNLESIYGPYSGNSTGVVVDPVPSGINYALETQDRSFFPRSTR